MYNFLAPLKMSSLVTSTAPARDTEPGSQVSSPEKAMGSKRWPPTIHSYIRSGWPLLRVIPDLLETEDKGVENA